jgi:hypothetical protein
MKFYNFKKYEKITNKKNKKTNLKTSNNVFDSQDDLSAAKTVIMATVVDFIVLITSFL